MFTSSIKNIIFFPALGYNTVFLLLLSFVSNKSCKFFAVVFAEKVVNVFIKFYGNCPNQSNIITDFPTPVYPINNIFF